MTRHNAKNEENLAISGNGIILGSESTAAMISINPKVSTKYRILLERLCFFIYATIWISLKERYENR